MSQGRRTAAPGGRGRERDWPSPPPELDMPGAPGSRGAEATRRRPAPPPGGAGASHGESRRLPRPRPTPRRCRRHDAASDTAAAPAPERRPCGSEATPRPAVRRAGPAERAWSRRDWRAETGEPHGAGDAGHSSLRVPLRRPLGEILSRRRSCPAEKLDEALATQAGEGRPAGRGARRDARR